MLSKMDNLKCHYSSLNFIKEICSKNGISKKVFDKKSVELKRKIRSLLKSIDSEPKNSWKRYDDYTRYFREEYDWVFTKEEVRNYIDGNWIFPINSPYDCTGKYFTTRLCVFPLPKTGKTVIYHFQTIDC